MTAEIIPACEPAEWRFKDRTGATRPFHGWFVDSVSTERPGVPRWTEMEVYRRLGGGWVLRVVGCSVIYHRANSECNTGEPVKGQDMDADMVPCKWCRPGDYLRPEMNDVEFDVEVEIPSLQVARTPAELVQMMREDKDGAISYPAHRLLKKLKLHDSDIARELNKPVPL